jgi:hypothetical protein
VADFDKLENAAGDLSDASMRLSTYASRLFGAAAKIVMATLDGPRKSATGEPLANAAAAAVKLREVLAARIPELQRELANLETAIGELERATPS